MLTKLSSRRALELKIMLDNLFIVEYMPYAPDSYVKVYLYGLSLASHNLESDNDLGQIAKRLMLEPGAVMEAFRYWEGQGLVAITGEPAVIEYLPVGRPEERIKKFSKEKYKTFNDQLHAMLPHRNILPNEYNEYYSIMESMHIETAAMLTIIAYCIRLKGEDIGYPYILAVARNLAHEGCTTYDRVQEKLSEFDLYNKDLAAVLKALGTKKPADHEDKRLFIKWTKTFGFKLETVVQVAKTVKKGGVAYLDTLLTKYYENRLFTVPEIEEYTKNRDAMRDLAKNINRIIGVYYEQLDYIIEAYITKWLGMGFESEALVVIAEYCFKHSVKTLEGMSSSVEMFYNKGLLTVESINKFLLEAISYDEKIKAILLSTGADRVVTSRDRDSYRTWVYSWKMPDALIDYAASLSKSKSNPIIYMNSILGGWHDKNITTVEEAKAAPAAVSPEPSSAVKKNYSAEELNALFDSLSAEDM